MHPLLVFIIYIILSFPSFTSGHRNPFLQSTSLPPPPPPTTSTIGQFLTAHNAARSKVKVGLVTWSPKLASNASLTAHFQRTNKSCQLADLSGSDYGANQPWANFPATPAEVVGSWVREGQYYNHVNNTCAAGHECGTYTQVVWSKTAQVGCAQARCVGGSSLTLCLYYPHGNVQGQAPY